MTRPGDAPLRNRMNTWLRALVAVTGALGLLGGAAQAHALVVRERAALEARVEVLRGNLRAPAGADAGTDAGTNAGAPRPDTTLAQWFNWPNWNNWNNWPNWGNWGNWGNWFNR